MPEFRQRAAYGQPGAWDITLRLTADELAVAGGDAGDLVVWLGEAIDALVRMRSGAWDDPQVARAQAWQTVAAVYHRMQPRLGGVLSAAIRAHLAAGGSVGDLAAAMDTSRSTAQTRREHLPDPPGVWEQWATSTQHTSTTDKEDVMGRRIFTGGNVSINSTVGDQVNHGGGGASVRVNGGHLVINGQTRECLECGPDTKWGDCSVTADGVVVKCLKCRTTWTLH